MSTRLTRLAFYFWWREAEFAASHSARAALAERSIHGENIRVRDIDEAGKGKTTRTKRRNNTKGQLVISLFDPHLEKDERLNLDTVDDIHPPGLLSTTQLVSGSGSVGRVAALKYLLVCTVEKEVETQLLKVVFWQIWLKPRSDATHSAWAI